MQGRPFTALLLASMKAYYRNRQAVFFSLFFPLMFMVIFGLLNLGGSASVDIGVADEAHNPASTQIIASLRHISAVKLHVGTASAERSALDRGERDVVALIPANVGATPSPIIAYLNMAKPREAQVGSSILEQVANRVASRSSGAPSITVSPQQLPGRNVTYVDFLVPGMIAFSVMQTGIFSLAFALVRMKEGGVLRRLQATPMRMTDFMAAQVLTRLIMGVLQVILLLVVGILLLHFHLVGNVLEVLFVATLGSAVFIALGFVVAGVSKNEDSVPAIANLIAFPMMFLSGIFYSRSLMPAWLHQASDFLPLSYLADALRSISIDGTHLWGVGRSLAGITVWLAITVVLATRVFKWEAA